MSSVRDTEGNSIICVFILSIFFNFCFWGFSLRVFVSLIHKWCRLFMYLFVSFLYHFLYHYASLCVSNVCNKYLKNL